MINDVRDNLKQNLKVHKKDLPDKLFLGTELRDLKNCLTGLRIEMWRGIKILR